MPPRVSITKLQRETAIATDLLDLCTAITEDGHLDDSEVKALGAWLAENRDQPLPAIGYLTETVERILADGRVTPDEHRDLYQAIEKVLPPDLRAEVRGTRVAIEQADRELARESKAQARAAEAEARARNLPIERYDFMVAGVGYDGRHRIVEEYAEVGEPVELVREPRNRYSKNAVRVALAGKRIGYVPEQLATELAPMLDSKHQHRARIKKVLEGRRYPIPVVIAEVFRPEAELPPPTGSLSLRVRFEPSEAESVVEAPAAPEPAMEPADIAPAPTPPAPAPAPPSDAPPPHVPVEVSTATDDERIDRKNRLVIAGIIVFCALALLLLMLLVGVRGL